MMTHDLLSMILRSPASGAVAWALVHFAWQGTAIAGVTAIAFGALRGRSPQARYLAGLAALAAMLAAPVVTAGAITASLARESAMTPPSAISAGPAQPAAGPAAGPAGPARLGAHASIGGPIGWTAWLLAGWVTGVFALSLRLAAGGGVVRARVRRAASPGDGEWTGRIAVLGGRMGLSSRVRVLSSALVRVPCAVGALHPVILVPVGVLAGLSPNQLEAILAHELAHIRRHDYLANLLQTCVETVLFYHPAVWWVSGRVRAEREHCCDDAAVRVCGDAVSYARALATLEAFRGASGLAMAASGGPC